jgi:phosphate transport system substrate-binding protein
MKKVFRTSGVAVAASLALVAVGVTPAFAKASTEAQILNNALQLKTAASPAITTGGSSFDANLVQAALTQYQSLSANNKSSFSAYASTKSGTGRAGAISGALNIGFSDFPLNFAGTDTTSPQNYVQVPVALGGVAIIYNINFPSNVTTTDANHTSFTATTTDGCAAILAKYPLILDGATLGKIFAGKITSWNNATIKALNSKLVFKEKVAGDNGKTGSKLAQKNTSTTVNCLDIATQPSIAVESRTSGSGTTFMFQDYLSKVDNTDFPAPTSNAFAAAATTFSGSSTLAPAVGNTDGSIGYVEYGYALTAGLPVARLVNASGDVVSLSAKSVLADASAGIAAINAGSGFSLAYTNGSTAGFSITNAVGAANYPIAGFSYAITPVAQPNATTAIAVAKFLLFLTQQSNGSDTNHTWGQNLAGPNGYVPMPKSLQAIAYNLIAGTGSLPGVQDGKGNSVVNASN